MADTDIYGRFSNAFGGAFAADSARLTFAGGADSLVGAGAASAGGVGLLTQNLSFSYQQLVSRLYEIGTNYAFYVSGRTQGSLSIGRVLGPRPVSMAFYQKYGSVCFAATNILTLGMATACTSPATSNSNYGWKMSFCVITSISVSVNAQDMLVNEQLQMMFAALNLNAPTSAATPRDVAAAITAGFSGGFGSGGQGDPSVADVSGLAI